jgi:hypothetical protein
LGLTQPQLLPTNLPLSRVWMLREHQDVRNVAFVGNPRRRRVGHRVGRPSIPNTTLFLRDINSRNPPSMAEFPLILLQKQSDFDSPMRRFESSRPSQPLPMREKYPRNDQKGPQLACFCDLVDCLYTLVFTKSEANLPKVSGHHPDCSHFRETDARD